MRKTIDILWLVIAAVSVPVFFYVLFDEGFLRGKAYMFLLTALPGAWVLYKGRKKASASRKRRK